MKKLLALGLMSLTLAQAKIFVGVDGGYTMNGRTASNTVDSPVWHGKWIDAYNIGLNFGVEHFVNDRFGVRALIDATYKGPFTDRLHILNVGLGGDMIVNLVTGSFSMGIFAGAGIAYNLQMWNNASIIAGELAYIGRTGLTFGFGENARLDLTVKLPIAATHLHGNNNIGVSAPIDYQAGLKILF